MSDVRSLIREEWKVFLLLALLLVVIPIPIALTSPDPATSLRACMTGYLLGFFWGDSKAICAVGLILIWLVL